MPFAPLSAIIAPPVVESKLFEAHICVTAVDDGQCGGSGVSSVQGGLGGPKSACVKWEGGERAGSRDMAGRDLGEGKPSFSNVDISVTNNARAMPLLHDQDAMPTDYMHARGVSPHLWPSRKS